jgi:hypothetical protein
MSPLEHSITLRRQCLMTLDWIGVRYDGPVESRALRAALDRSV